MSEPSCAHQWQVARNPAGRAMRVCQLCGKAEQDPAMKVLFTAEKPLIPGWYWHRMSRGETEPVVVYVEPQRDRVGTGEAQPSHTLSHTEGEWAGPLEMPDK